MSRGHLCPGRSLSRGVYVQQGLCLGRLCPGGSLHRGVCPGGLCPGGLCGGSLWGISVQGVSFREIPLPPYSNVRMVCILLECILFRIFFRESMWSVYTLSSYTLESGFCAVSRRLSFYTCLSVHGWGGSPGPHPGGG